jgi:RNA polymerase sigma factor (sigma-70 family)
MKKTIVILSGKAGAGKDTFAEMLGGAWERISFADEVKATCSELVDLHMDFFHKRELKDSPMLIGGKIQTPRDLCVSVGMYYRGIDPHYWTKKAVEKIRNSKSEFFVITDWRFPNELEAIQRAFETEDSSGDSSSKAVHSVRIVGRDALGSTHESECALDNYPVDYVIINRSSLDILQEKARLLGVVTGEPEATESAYNELLPKATNLVRKHTHNQSDIKDATQEALYEVLKQMKKKFNFTCSLWTFAYKVIYFHTQNFRRKGETYSNAFYFSDAGVDNLESAGKSDLHSPFLGKKIEAAVATLSEFDRKLFEMRHAGWKHKEIGEALGIKENYSRRRLFSIHKRLQEQLKDVYLDFIE